MTEEEKKLVYHGEGEYKGWRAAELGCGLLVMRKGENEVRTQRGLDVPSDKWVFEVWTEAKRKIDAIENSESTESA